MITEKTEIDSLIEFRLEANVDGDVNWYTGFEEIYCNDIKVYECYFHGGLMKGS